MAVALSRRIDGPAGGPVLVLIGSLGSNLTMWEPQYTALSDEFRVLTADLRGHGASPAPAGPYAIADLAADVLALADAVAPGNPVHLVGLSLGGAVAQRIAAHAPDRLASLTLLCTSARFSDPQPWHERAASVRADGTASIAESVAGRWFTPGFAAQNPQLVARSRVMVADTPDEGYAACCEALAGWDGRGDLGRITAPTLAIAGAQDPATGPEHLRAITDGIARSINTDPEAGTETPRAALHVLDPAAHLANAEQVDAVNDLIRAHVRAAGGRK